MTFLALYWFAIAAGITGIAVIVFVAISLDSLRSKIAVIIITISIAGLAILGNIWYVNGTQSGLRLQNNTRSDFEGGINRIITVYDLTGKEVETYEGHYDIKWEDNRVLFDNAETGERHVIYLTTFNVITDEMS